jgi:L-threonate 2-dehydrogenase
VVDVLSSRVMRVGTRVGMASRAKLVNNLMAAINLAGMAEAMAMAERFGLNPKHMLEIMESSSGQNWIGSDRLVRRLRGETEVHASVALMAHETRAALMSAQAEGLHTPIGRAALLEYTRACEHGLGGKDDSEMFDHARDSGSLDSDVVESFAVDGEAQRRDEALEASDAIKALSRRAAAL